jgi:hypothetical protein
MPKADHTVNERPSARAAWADSDAVSKILRPADIILTKSSEKLHPVALYQNFYQFPPEASRFIHAAIYVGNGDIVHSTFERGVVKEKLHRLIVEREFVVLRFRKFFEASDEILPIQEKIASNAINYVGNGYDYNAVTQLAAAGIKDIIFRGQGSKSVRNISNLASRHPDELKISDYGPVSDFICSDLVFCCYDIPMRQENPLNKIMITLNRVPAEFYINPLLYSISFLRDAKSNVLVSRVIDASGKVVTVQDRRQIWSP